MPNINLTPPQSVRMFVGYRNPSLEVPRYREELGRTFMPGTPYMLQPMGLQAYLAAAIDETVDPSAPHEVALIAYPSQALYARARNDTLRGRVYTQIHGGVYDASRSGGAWPVPLPSAAPNANAVSLFPDAIDWQAGNTHVLVAVPSSTAAGQEFRNAGRDLLASAGDAVKGCDQVLAALRDNCLVVWLHAPESEPPVEAVEKHLGTRVRVVAKHKCERIICLHEPPPVEITGSAAFNFIFVRDPNAGLA